MKIAVTGANGYLGSGVVNQLIAEGHTVIAVSRHTQNINKQAEIIASDIFDMSDPYIEMGEPDVLLHAAWQNGFIHNSESHINNLSKHVAFIEKMMKSDVRMISVLGTVHEVGFFEGSVNDSTPTNPTTYYGIAKNSLRQVTEMLAKMNNKQFQWLRAFYIVGDKKSVHSDQSVFGKIVRADLEKTPTFPFVQGKNQFDFMDYSDFVENVALAITQFNVDGIINIASGMPEQLIARITKFITDNNLSIKLDIGKYPDRPYDSKAIWGDNTKLKAIATHHLK